MENGFMCCDGLNRVLSKFIYLSRNRSVTVSGHTAFKRKLRLDQVIRRVLTQ